MQKVWVERGGVVEHIETKELEARTGALFIPGLDFADFSLLRTILQKSAKLQKKGELSREQLWFGAYFGKEVLAYPMPDVTLRYIDEAIGWGVFANRPFAKMEFVAEYAGKVRKRRRIDKKNAYCFEYPLLSGEKSPYTIDARDQGGIGRFINHSDEPNLVSALATVENLPHIVLMTKRPIAKGEQLCFDYGPDYWSCRSSPRKW